MIAIAVNLLHFQTRKEEFHRSVIIRNTWSGKRLCYSITVQQISELAACVLPSLVAVKQQILWGTSGSKGILECMANQAGIFLRIEMCRHYSSGKEIQNCTQTARPCICFDICDIAKPCHIGPRWRKLSIQQICAASPPYKVGKSILFRRGTMRIDLTKQL